MKGTKLLDPKSNDGNRAREVSRGKRINMGQEEGMGCEEVASSCGRCFGTNNSVESSKEGPRAR